jgi:hypothetical protein
VQFAWQTFGEGDRSSGVAGDLLNPIFWIPFLTVSHLVADWQFYHAGLNLSLNFSFAAALP